MSTQQSIEDLEMQLAALRAAEGSGLPPVEDNIPDEIPDDVEASVDRTPRFAETRAAEEAPKTWQPASTLPEPMRRPGIEHRWVRISMLGHIDNTNVSGKFREHWVPVRASEYPEITVLADRDSQFPVGGLVLCRNAVETMDQRRAHFARLAKSQGKGYDAAYEAEEQHPMPVHSDLGRRTDVKFGTGSRAE